MLEVPKQAIICDVITASAAVTGSTGLHGGGRT